MKQKTEEKRNRSYRKKKAIRTGKKFRDAVYPKVAIKYCNFQETKK